MPRGIPRLPLTSTSVAQNVQNIISQAPRIRPGDASVLNGNAENPHSDSMQELFRRRRKTEWKRRQGGQTFLDHLIVTVRGGKGGDGCVAFHREKFKPFGPPSGGNGGRGGDVYFLPTGHLTTLSGIPKRIRGNPGASGQGTWQNGKAGAPLIIKVPLGTVVRELQRGDPRRSKDQWEAEEESMEGMTLDERKERMRENRWVHFPKSGDENLERDAFKDAEIALYTQERERKFAKRRREREEPIFLDLEEEEADVKEAVDAPLGVGKHEPTGRLIASGGAGGLGNPHFLSSINRAPKFATKGHDGDRLTLELELKLVADVGLVGMPNAGKSTLLRALTGGRAKSEIAGYAFTTLNPVVGVVRVGDDGNFEGGKGDGGQDVYDETWIEEKKEMERAAWRRHADADALSKDENLRPRSYGHSFDLYETNRFTIADNPGLVPEASKNVGLGHSFLRSMERSLALVYVVDLSAEAPWDELKVLKIELEEYLKGMSGRARMVVANKADLIGGDGEEEEVARAKEKLKKLEEFVKTEMLVPDVNVKGGMRILEVVPTSAKYSQNMKKVVGLMKKYVKEAKDAQKREGWSKVTVQKYKTW